MPHRGVVIAGVDDDIVEGAHGIAVKTDILLKDYKEMPDAIVLPGGMPGAENLAKSLELKDLIIKMYREKRIVAAICASPALVLASTGILSGKKATCYPGLEKNFLSNVNFVVEEVVQTQNIITSRGVGTAFAFGLKISENLVGKEKSDAIAEQMLYK